jgi:hypothetical protein
MFLVGRFMALAIRAKLFEPFFGSEAEWRGWT